MLERFKKIAIFSGINNHLQNRIAATSFPVF